LLHRAFEISGCALSAAIFLALTASWAPAAYAYLDPGTGSLVVQMVIGAFAAAGAALTLYWHRLKRFFTRSKLPREAPVAPVSPGDGDGGG